MPAGPQSSNTVVVFVPTAGVDFGRRQYPNNLPRGRQTKREPWSRQPIPSRPQVDRELVDKMREQGKRVIEQQRSQIKAMLGRHAICP
jgi:hypothetical protein